MSLMKFIKHRDLFPCLINSLQSSPNQTQVTQPLPPSRKKALLIDIQNARQDTIQITQAEEDVHIAPRRKKKAQKDRYEEGALLKSKGPHCDILEMKQLLISA